MYSGTVLTHNVIHLIKFIKNIWRTVPGHLLKLGRVIKQCVIHHLIFATVKIQYLHARKIVYQETLRYSFTAATQAVDMQHLGFHIILSYQRLVQYGAIFFGLKTQVVLKTSITTCIIS